MQPPLESGSGDGMKGGMDDSKMDDSKMDDSKMDDGKMDDGKEG